MKPIGMDEMAAVFAVVDALQISREKVEVPLLTQGSGSLRRLGSGKLEITLPEDRSAEEWMQAERDAIAEIAADLLGSAE